MRVLSVSSEFFPLVKTGGLADVAGALPAALKPHGVEMLPFIPGYPAVMAAAQGAAELHRYPELFGGKARVLMALAHGLDIAVLDAPHLYDRPGNPYLAPDGKDWPDNGLRFAALARVAAELGAGRAGAPAFDVLHSHDWQAALAPVYAKFGGGPKTVMTVHNIAFQGQFPASLFASLGLPSQAFGIEGVEYYGNVGFLKGGLATASAITTVSPSYAREICTPEFGMGLDGLLRARHGVLHGIVNGIDTAIWNPATDPHIAGAYTRASLRKREANKRALEKRFDLIPGGGILHGVVSRLTWQKGMDVLAACLGRLAESGARLALIGAGEPAIEKAIIQAAARHKGLIGAVIGYDEALSHLVQAGADTILVPSRFEPCGLTQLYALRYGAVPVVARTGGLNDTVIDANDAAIKASAATGFQFAPVDELSLDYALMHAARCFDNKPLWRGIQKNGMASDLSWERSAAAYAELYRDLPKA